MSTFFVTENGIRINKVLLDPPRKGAAREAVETIIRLASERIAYVSCDPATLARDCRIFAEGGYSIASVQPVDMFPQTAHVETVVVMSR